MASQNIFAQYAQPIRGVADYANDMDRRELLQLQLAGQQGQNALLQLTRQQQAAQARQGIEKQNALQALLSDPRYAEPDAREAAMLKHPLLQDEGLKFQKQRIENRSAEAQAREREASGRSSDAETLKRHLDVLKTLSGGVMANPTMQSAQFALDAFERLTGRQMPEDRAALSQLTSPEQIKQWAAAHALTADQLLPKLQSINTGQMTVQQAVDPVTGKPTTTGQLQNTQSPDNVATNATSRANNAAQVGATLRGQDLLDARAREANAASLSKPFEVTGPDGAPVLVQQDKAGNVRPVAGYAPKSATDKPLPQAVVKTVTEARDNAATIERLRTAFKPDFAGKGVLGFGADMQVGASGVLGMDKDAVAWWKDYRKQAELVERHAMFGASLTAAEQSAWRSADIGPGLDAAVISRNLTTRAELARKVADAAKQDMIDAGHNAKRVSAIAERGAAAAPPAPVAPGTDLGGGFKVK